MLNETMNKTTKGIRGLSSGNNSITHQDNKLRYSKPRQAMKCQPGFLKLTSRLQGLKKSAEFRLCLIFARFFQVSARKIRQMIRHCRIVAEYFSKMICAAPMVAE